MFGVDLHDCVTFLQEGVDSSGHFGSIFDVAVDIEGWILCELSGCGKTDAEHVLLLAGNGEIVIAMVVVHQIHLFEVIVPERVSLELSRSTADCEQKQEQAQAKSGVVRWLLKRHGIRRCDINYKG